MYFFIINPNNKNKNALTVWNTLKHKLDKDNIKYTYYVTSCKGHSTQFAMDICNRFPEQKHIIIVGNSTTVNEVTNGISDYSAVIIDYIPVNQNEELAKLLKITQTPLELLDKILNSKNYNSLNYGLLNLKDNYSLKNRKFCTSTKVGIDKKQLLTLNFKDATVVIDGKPHTYKKLALATSQPNKNNNAEHTLSVYLVHDMSILKLFALLPTLLLKKFRSKKFSKRPNKCIDEFDCSSIEIISDNALNVHIDGEYAGTSSHIVNSYTHDQIRMSR